MIPVVDHDAILQAMRRFDQEFRGSREWAEWEQNQAHKYAIEHDGRCYPVKQIVSLATTVPVSEFSGGEGPGHANRCVRESGFEVVALRPDSSEVVDAGGTPGHPKGVQAYLDEFLTRYSDIRSSKSFGVDQELWRILSNLRAAVESTPPLRTRSRLRVRWSVGAGNWAKVPWVAFLDERETTSTQRGVYGVFLFRQDMSGVYLTFNQGVTEPKKQHGSAAGLQLLKEHAAALRHECDALARRGFALDDKVDLRTEPSLGKDYETSTPPPLAARRRHRR